MHCHAARKIFYPQGLQTEIRKAAKVSVCASIYVPIKQKKWASQVHVQVSAGFGSHI